MQFVRMHTLLGIQSHKVYVFHMLVQFLWRVIINGIQLPTFDLKDIIINFDEKIL